MHSEKMYATCKRLLLRLAIVLMLTTVPFVQSCKTTKTSTQQHRQTTSTETLSAEEARTVRLTDDKAVTDLSVETAGYTLVVEHTEWSQPDSTGRQYPLSTTISTKTAAGEKKNDIRIESKTEKNDDETTISSKTLNVADDVQTATDETVKVSTPAWVIVLVVAIVFAVFVLVYLFLKKWNIL